MKETVPQKPLEPVLHGFLLRNRKFVPSSKIIIQKLFGLISRQEA
ncbi:MULTISPECIES: hypothetical protein [unclassified Methanosarcina]|nr:MULTISPECIES: hypothetical protein [unclassified Methanosarcina]